MTVIPNNVKLTLPLKWLSLGDLLLADQMKAKNARRGGTDQLSADSPSSLSFFIHIHGCQCMLISRTGPDHNGSKSNLVNIEEL